MQIGSLPPRPSPREAGGGRGGAQRSGGGDAGRGGGGEERGEGRAGPPAPRVGQGAAGRVCSPPNGLLRAGAPRPLPLLLLLLLLLVPLSPLPTACVRSSRAGILGAPRPARSLGRPPAPPPGLAPPSGPGLVGRGVPGTGEPHSDTGAGLAAARPGPVRRVRRRLLGEPGRPSAPVLQPARSQPSASALRQRPIRAQHGGRAAGKPRARRPRPRAAAAAAAAAARESNSGERRRNELGFGTHGAPAGATRPAGGEC
jgi:hypothetical protein